MSDTTPPEPLVETPRGGGPRRRISAVWLVPLIALVVSLGVAWRTYSDRGPLIEIVFDNAAGIEAGQTQIRFRDVAVGLVEEVSFTPDLAQVVATARIDPEQAEYLDESALFWVVRPSVSAQGVTGIETVISGVYVEAYWDADAGQRAQRFTALPSAPLTPAGQPGLRVRLRAPDGGSVTVGAPVLFNRIQVGTIETIDLTPEGDVVMDLFIDAPNHTRLTTATRFWNASGFSIELGASGAALNVESLIALLQGGIAFDTVTSGGEPVEVGYVYQLYPSETAARQSIIEDDPESTVTLTVRFEGSVRGLQPGASVQFRGIPVGEVVGLQARVEPGPQGEPVVATDATIVVNAARMGLSGENLAGQLLNLLETRVAEGLRAQLASANLLTGALFVDLAELPDAEPAEFDRGAEPFPVLPSAPSDVGGFAQSAQGVLDRVASLPVEEVLDAGVTLLANLNQLVTDEEIRAAPENLGALLADLRQLVNQDAVQQAPGELAALLASVRAVVEEATERQLVASLVAALEGTEEAVASLGTAVEGVPGLVEEIRALAAEANELPLDALVASATGLVADADALVGSEAVTNLPASVEAALAELRGILSELRAGGAVENANATLASLRGVSDEIAQAELAGRLSETLAAVDSAVGSVGAASEGLPPLVEELRALTAEARSLPFEDLLAAATRLVTDIDLLVQSEAVATLPASAQAALADLRLLVADLRAGGAVENVNATLVSVRELADALAEADLATRLAAAIADAEAAAANVNSASAGLPALVEELNALSGRVEALPLEALVASSTDLLRTADTFLADEDVAALPPALTAAFGEIEALLAELREGGAVTNVNATLASADQAAAAVTAAATELPALLEQLGAVAARADAALTTVTPGSDINRDTQALLREVRDAARAVQSLVTALERRPNSVLFGR